ncbi:MAG: ergothioneine biosynthesis protein EgtC [Mycobacteriaceae bacterium]
MCRHLAFLGPPCAVGELLTRGPHSLQTQSWAPRDMRGGGTVNADGYGAAWWSEGATVRYRSARPMWTDTDGSAVLAGAHSGAVLAAVRSATVGMPVISTASAPFTDGHWAFSHNGLVPGWPHSLVSLAQTLPMAELLAMDAPTDSALLWTALRPRLSHDPVGAVADLVLRVAGDAPGSRLNLLLSDGQQLIATAWGHSLSYLVGPEHVVLASEPYDDDSAWQSVPEHSLVTARPGEVTVTALELR